MDEMTRLVKEKVKQIKEVNQSPEADTEQLVAFVEMCEVKNADPLVQRGYLAGYLRGVAEATDVTVSELLDNL